MSDKNQSKNKRAKKLKYEKPKIESEKIQSASAMVMGGMGGMGVCNGMTMGGRKATPCTIQFT